MGERSHMRTHARTHTHNRARARTHTRTHAHTHSRTHQLHWFPIEAGILLRSEQWSNRTGRDLRIHPRPIARPPRPRPLHGRRRSRSPTRRPESARGCPDRRPPGSIGGLPFVAPIPGPLETRPLSCGRAPGREARALEFKSLKVPPPAASAKPAASGGARRARGRGGRRRRGAEGGGEEGARTGRAGWWVRGGRRGRRGSPSPSEHLLYGTRKGAPPPRPLPHGACYVQTVQLRAPFHMARAMCKPCKLCAAIPARGIFAHAPSI